MSRTDTAADKRAKSDNARRAKETTVLDHLTAAWKSFEELPETHPDDNPDFRRAIHECQRIIGLIRLRRIDPETWPSYLPPYIRIPNE